MNDDLKSQVRAELFRCAFEGKFPTYAEFFGRLRPGSAMGNFPYQTHFDAIAKEERAGGYPDLTFIVRSADGFPRKIDSRDANPSPDENQIKSLRDGTDEIIRLYCPTGTKNPYRG